MSDSVGDDALTPVFSLSRSEQASTPASDTLGGEKTRFGGTQGDGDSVLVAEILAALCRTRAQQVIQTYRDKGWTVACAESLTAGLLCSTLADIPGASAVLRGGLVVYATDLKVSLAGVPAEIVEADGAVAPTTAAALAQGARTRCGADIGVALTGVAGPEPQEGKPVGTVYLGWATQDGADSVLLEHTELAEYLPRSTWARNQVRYSSVLGALVRLLELVGEGI